MRSLAGGAQERGLVHPDRAHRRLISERTLDGLEAARGRKGGRPSRVTPAKLATARKLYDAQEHTMAEIAEIAGIPRSTLYKHLRRDKAATA